MRLLVNPRDNFFFFVSANKLTNAALRIEFALLETVELVVQLLIFFVSDGIWISGGPVSSFLSRFIIRRLRQ